VNSWPGRFAIIGLLSFATMLAFMMGDHGPTVAAKTDAPTAYSFQPTGYRMLRALLAELGRDAVVSRGNSAARGRRGLVVLAEPDPALSVEGIHELADRCDRVLLVLPKWKPIPGDRRYGLVRGRVVNKVLDEAGLNHLRVVRRADPRWLDQERFSVNPEVRGDVQLLAEGSISPLLECDEGVLLGVLEKDGTVIYVLADPDPLANHGLTQGGNATFAVEVLEHCSQGGPVVFDETVHGLHRAPGLVDSVTSFPLVLVVIQGALMAAALVWYAGRRMGRPITEELGIEAGKGALLDNVARLQTLVTRDQTGALRRYWEATWNNVATSLRGVAHGQDPERTARVLGRVASDRGCASPEEMARRVDQLVKSPRRGERPVVEMARRIRAWRKEMSDGTDTVT